LPEQIFILKRLIEMVIASQPFSLNLVITEPTKLPLAIDGSEISVTKE
jgi:hypothetical protein